MCASRQKGRHATIDVSHTRHGCGFPPAIEEVIRVMGKHETGVTWGWGDVCMSGCILFDVPAERAETLARVLYWLAMDSRCDYRKGSK